jgi:uncharacterized protein (TIGR00251 family)
VEKEPLNVRIQPNASKNEVLGLKDGRWQMKIAAQPVRGMANRELIRFLSDILEISKGSIAIETGMTSRMKTLSISGLARGELEARLERHIKGKLRKQ